MPLCGWDTTCRSPCQLAAWSTLLAQGSWPRGAPASLHPTAPLLHDAPRAQGAIYVTDNGAYTWSAAVQETVDATLNRTVSSGEGGRAVRRGRLLVHRGVRPPTG